MVPARAQGADAEIISLPVVLREDILAQPTHSGSPGRPRIRQRRAHAPTTEHSSFRQFVERFGLFVRRAERCRRRHGWLSAFSACVLLNLPALDHSVSNPPRMGTHSPQLCAGGTPHVPHASRKSSGPEPPVASTGTPDILASAIFRPNPSLRWGETKQSASRANAKEAARSIAGNHHNARVTPCCCSTARHPAERLGFPLTRSTSST
jgi:hypothetical protein